MNNCFIKNILIKKSNEAFNQLDAFELYESYVNVTMSSSHKKYKFLYKERWVIYYERKRFS